MKKVPRYVYLQKIVSKWIINSTRLFSKLKYHIYTPLHSFCWKFKLKPEMINEIIQTTVVRFIAINDNVYDDDFFTIHWFH